ncbi:MAG: T9SS type A sorting domain-containing protein [Chitinophagaceae bacterium]
MKTILRLKILLTSLIVGLSFYQSYSQKNTGLVFRNPVLQSGTNLQQGAVYLFSNVYSGTDATVKIDSLVNGAQVMKIDDNSGGLGYIDAFQPEIRIPRQIGDAYAAFTFNFYETGTTNPKLMNNIQASAVDIDGNPLLKEFAEIDFGGGVASFMSTTLDINVVQLLLKNFRGSNILGIERNGIDTSALGNMFTVTKSNVSSFSAKYGASTLNANPVRRQYSLYMKGFAYPNQITLPVDLVSFSAILNADQVDLKWTTASEKNVSHFSIEKSTDGKNYSEAGIVFAYGNTSETMKYSFPDKNINTSNTGVIYYRLRSVDIDGRSELSTIRSIRIGTKGGQGLSILAYPNPVTNELRVTIPSNWQGKKVSYELYNKNGQVVVKNVEINSSQTQALNVNSLAPGFYIAKVICDGEVAQQKIIKR